MKMPATAGGARIARAVRRDWMLILLILPAVAYFVIFHYAPMYGLVIAFKRYYVSKGIWGSPWVGFQWFGQFFRSVYFTRLIGNTLAISVYSIVFGFPIPIVFALLLNEVRNDRYKRVIQTVSYLPHFISTVVVVAILQMLLSMQDGVINELLARMGGQKINFLMEPKWFRPLYVGSGIWQQYGWNSIIYLAAITGVDLSLYEAAHMDGSSRWQNIWHITLPCILPTIGTLLILRIGNIMSVGFEKIILMYNEKTFVTADVISTYTYRRGILNADYSFATAVGLFNSVINLVVLVTANRMSRKLTEVSLW
jgi:putative aldouronate transport system permease protein